MRVILADTFYWIALLNPKDKWHLSALAYGRKQPNIRLIVTDGIVDEVLNYFAEEGTFLRNNALNLCQSMKLDRNIEIVAYTPELRRLGMDLYQNRPDKGYSMTDCISMVVMREMNITDVLTADRHFQQEGFTILF
ncbi:type II toxin-antitoxin system VapC family toxin [Pseudanabaena sp. ABRG5-3]|uniref:type II toxin-antitoxin system VapC family toxin n=1 Tax=Pseudanabaena sp. ABRG5-3 TaxID=685565 RepID=UPI000DC73DCD|nr:type II toxin-antitoxin system VapC family toxin [Pseudanabaena sp. ABRG5-3]BBC22908.1 PIN domain nucleic acid-binding protein [Pseudanabaena sp. ABRG5-3]